MSATELSLTAELLLLMHEDDGRARIRGAKRNAVTAGAAITQLALDGALELAEDASPRKARLRATGVPARQPWLTDALERADGRKPKDAVARVGGQQDFRFRAQRIRESVMGELVRTGVVGRVDARLLGLVPPRWPLLRPEVKAEVTRGSCPSSMGGRRIPERAVSSH